MDFVSAFAVHVPSSVIGELLGLDPSLYPQIRLWGEHLTRITAVRPDDHERQAAVRTSVDDMKRYLGEVLERRRRQPGDDMVSDLLDAQVDGESLTDAELMAFLFLLVIAGIETTVHLLGHRSWCWPSAPICWPGCARIAR